MWSKSTSNHFAHLVLVDRRILSWARTAWGHQHSYSQTVLSTQAGGNQFGRGSRTTRLHSQLCDCSIRWQRMYLMYEYKIIYTSKWFFIIKPSGHTRVFCNDEMTITPRYRDCNICSLALFFIKYNITLSHLSECVIFFTFYRYHFFNLVVFYFT